MGLLDGKLDGVAALIDLFGGTVVLRRIKEGEYNPDTQKKDKLEPFGSPHTTKGVWAGYLAGIASFDLGTDGVVKPGDRRAYIKAKGLPFDPEAGDILEFPNSDTTKPNIQYRIENADPIGTGVQILVWDVHVRI